MKRNLKTIAALAVVMAVMLPPGAFSQEGGAASDYSPMNFNAPPPQDRDFLGCKAALDTYESMGCDGNCSDECRSVGQDLASCQDIGNRSQVACTN
jgi:hypothetical protein